MSTMVVATKYKLSRLNGAWSKEQKTKICTKVVSRQFVEDRNSHDNNEYYIIDEEATAELQEKRQEQIQLNAVKKAKKNLDQTDLIDAFVKMANKGGGNSEKEELQAELDEMGVDYDKRMGVKKLKELIELNK